MFREILLAIKHFLDNAEEYQYCHECYHERKKYEYIHDYNYKPAPNFLWQRQQAFRH